jgi:DNA-binding transcriptional ArsR family regulator
MREKYVFRFFEIVFKDDVRFKIITILLHREGACLRELARNVGMSHKNLAKYLEVLVGKGVVDLIPVGIRDKIYRLNPNYVFLREVMQ